MDTNHCKCSTPTCQTYTGENGVILCADCDKPSGGISDWHRKMVEATPMDFISQQRRAAERENFLRNYEAAKLKMGRNFGINIVYGTGGPIENLAETFDEYSDWDDAPKPQPLRNFRK